MSTNTQHQWWFEEPSLEGRPQSAILVALQRRNQKPEEVEEHLRELAFLTKTLGLQVVDTVVQRRPYPHPRTFIGPGKLKEISALAKQYNVGYLIFDDDLTPAQIHHIEKESGIPALDRTDVILMIFARHARTNQARLQVQLARLQHMLPRLKRMWTHLERQRGGIGHRGGAGEREIEKDRRIIKNKIAQLRKKLKEIEKQGEVRRRRRQEMVRVAMVGYTNVGKTTLMNLLAHENLLAENKLFATLDTTVRRVVIDNVPFLLSDTVGFIRKLPHELVESFKNTLAEAREADIILHVIDVSHPSYKEQIKTVNRTLKQVGVVNKPTIYVFNKVDILMKQKDLDLQEIERQYSLDVDEPQIFISATEGINIDKLKKTILREVIKQYKEKYPHLVPRIGLDSKALKALEEQTQDAKEPEDLSVSQQAQEDNGFASESSGKIEIREVSVDRTNIYTEK
ncbi:MAG: GTPase HflX [Chlorobi bacterium]|nr:GTPase HflX [Chlorobiota bacterium]